MTPDFKPSDVMFTTIPPLMDTMKNVESEGFAALMVETCKEMGDKWKSLEPRDIGTTIRKLLDAKQEPWHSLNTNPFFRPDIHRMIKGGFAEWAAEEGGPVQFTNKGYEALRKYVRKDK